MFKFKKQIIIGGSVVLALGLVVLIDRLVVREPQTPPAGDKSVQTEKADTPENNQTTLNSLPRYVGRPIDEVRFGAGFSAPDSAIAQKKSELAILAEALTNNPKIIVDDWIAVGVIKKFFNDYEGARDVWEYAGVLFPENALLFANLGNLYGFYLNDKSKAELNYRRAIANDPYQTGYYLGLADFYKNVDTANKHKVPEVISEGLKYVQDVNLLLYLASYYRDVGDRVNAIKYYEEVLKISPNQPGVEEEIKRLTSS